MRHRFLSQSLEKQTFRSYLFLCLIVVGFLFLWSLVLDDRLLRSSLSSPNNSNNNNESSTKYIIVLGLRGLNNYILDLSNAGMMAKRLKRTLLIHPCVQNEHLHMESFRYNRTEHRLIQNFKCKTHVDFERLYRVSEGVPYEMVTESHPVWNYSQPINECSGGRGQSDSKQIRRLINCVNRRNSDPYVFFTSGLFYLGTKNVFDFSEHVYRLVNTAFAHRKINLQQTMVVHVRLGDYDQHCKHLQLSYNDCFIPLPDIEALLLQFQAKFDVKNVIVMTNGQLRQELLSRNNWIAVSDIVEELSVIEKDEPMDGNMRVVLEMATGVLSKYFVGNRYSTMSGSIAALRERSHPDFMNTTTSISALMGLRKETTYVNHLDYIKENGLWDYVGFCNQNLFSAMDPYPP